MDPLERRILNDFQRDFPLTARPYAELARRLGVAEATVLDVLGRLREEGAISRVGAVVAPHRLGSSTLAAMEVPAEGLDTVARIVSGYPEVNHNYEREHRLNLWFVVAAPSRQRVEQVLAEIAARTGIPALDLPLEQEYHIDLGFELQWT